MEFNIVPLGDRVVVETTVSEKVVAGVIFLPKEGQEQKQEGIVVALGEGGVGKDCINPRELLKVGDVVLYGKYAGDDIKKRDPDTRKERDFKILRIDSILGIVR